MCTGAENTVRCGDIVLHALDDSCDQPVQLLKPACVEDEDIRRDLLSQFLDAGTGNAGAVLPCSGTDR